MKILCEWDFLGFITVEVGEEVVIYVWIDIMLSRDYEEIGRGDYKNINFLRIC